MVVALFYGVLVSRGVENWFSTRVQTVVENSATVAGSYVEEQKRYIGDHVTFDGGGPQPGRSGACRKARSPSAHYLALQASYHAFPAAYLIDRDGRILARAESADAPPYVLPPQSSFKVARRGDHLGAGVRLHRPDARGLPTARLSDAYLYVVRPGEKGSSTTCARPTPR